MSVIPRLDSPTHLPDLRKLRRLARYPCFLLRFRLGLGRALLLVLLDEPLDRLEHEERVDAVWGEVRGQADEMGRGAGRVRREAKRGEEKGRGER